MAPYSKSTAPKKNISGATPTIISQRKVVKRHLGRLNFEGIDFRIACEWQESRRPVNTFSPNSQTSCNLLDFVPSSIATYLFVAHNSERFVLLLDCKADANFFQLLESCTVVLVSTDKKHQVIPPLEADKYEETLMSVASYIKHSVDEVTEVTENQKKSLNGPDGTVASKTVDSVQMIADGVLQLDGNFQAAKGEGGEYNVSAWFFL